MPADTLTRYWPAWLLPQRRRRTERLIEALREQVSRDHKSVVRELREIRRTTEQNQSRIDRALDAHEQALAVLPEIQARVDRCIAAYISDSRSPRRIEEFCSTVDRAATLAHARQAVERAR